MTSITPLRSSAIWIPQPKNLMAVLLLWIGALHNFGIHHVVVQGALAFTMKDDCRGTYQRVRCSSSSSYCCSLSVPSQYNCHLSHKHSWELLSAKSFRSSMQMTRLHSHDSEINDDHDNHDYSDDKQNSEKPSMSVPEILNQRYACTRFHRHQEDDTDIMDAKKSDKETASISNPSVVKQACQILDNARRSPSGFNVQPYKLMVISTKAQKEACAEYCCGHNAHRVRDSDCTVLFLADRQSMRGWKDYRSKILHASADTAPVSQKTQNQEQQEQATKRTWNSSALLKFRVLIALFSQGFPLPYWISAPLGSCLRFGMRIVSWITRRRLPIPTLASTQTWTQKNTMLVAMSYMLGCTSQNIQTCPMEGYCAWGVRQALKIPRRYSIPLIVATGSAYRRQTKQLQDDAGMAHGPKSMTGRYPREDVIYVNQFGSPITSPK